MCSTNSLSTLRPDVACMWDYDRNNGVTTQDVTSSSGKTFWWKCGVVENHKWKKSVDKMCRSTRCCPYCKNRKIDELNCLSVLNPKLASEWHYEMNGNLTPDMVGVGSSSIVYWKCIKNGDHVWRSKVYDRRKSGCPYCYKEKFEPSHREISGSYWKRVKRGARDRGLQVEITIEDAYDVFVAQNSRCALSGCFINFSKKETNVENRHTASLDRIDSQKGYVQGNIQWVHKKFQWMKGDLPQEEFVKRCGEVYKHMTKSEK